jgi:aspartyl-tRNA(Asn)/glutamyl-tRNA(Gln) amidotransferase subunit C
MSMDAQTIYKVAHLARIALNERDVVAFEQKLPNILAMIDRMQQLDTSSIAATPHALNTVQRLREDVVTENNLRDDYQKLCADVVDGVYLVPKVIESF